MGKHSSQYAKGVREIKVNTQFEPLTWIIILNFNRHKDCIQCVNSLLGLEYENFQILIIDNSSDVSDREKLREFIETLKLKCSKIKYLELPQNLGFAGGNNVGIKTAIEEGAEFIWLVNNDVIVAPKSLKMLVKCAQEEEKAAFVGSKIFFFDQPDLIQHAGGKVCSWKAVTRHIGLGQKDQPEFSKRKTVDFVTGASLLVRVKALNQIGLMDESYFLYWEDTNWMVRGRKKGWLTYYEPNSIVWHKGSITLAESSYLLTYYGTRNALIFARRNYSLLHFLCALFLRTGLVLFIILTSLIKREFKEDPKITVARILGIWHALRGKRGPITQEEIVNAKILKKYTATLQKWFQLCFSKK